MKDDELKARLDDIAGRFWNTAPRTILTGGGFPFDISKPNIHDTKKEFLREQKAIEQALEDTQRLLDLLIGKRRLTEDADPMAARLTAAIDATVRAKPLDSSEQSVSDFLVRSMVDRGLGYHAALVLFELWHGFNARKQELAEQEATFWSVNHRAPNHYARTIALRFAKKVASETGKRPTYGTSRDGGHPSTEFCRALEEVFELLGIEANVRNAAKWSVKQLTDFDLEKPRNVLAGPSLSELMGLGRPITHPKNAMEEITNALSKGREP